MEFRLLGPVQIRRANGDVIGLHRRQERLALAMLLLEPGRTVTTDRMIDLLWDQGPPAAARAILQTLMSRIRGALRSAADGAAGGQPLLLAQGQGYLLRVDAEAVDLHRFRALVDRARAIDDPAVRSLRLAAAGSVAFADRMGQAGLTDEVGRTVSSLVSSAHGVRRLPVPGRGDRGRGALVPALRPLVPRRGRTAR